MMDLEQWYAETEHGENDKPNIYGNRRMEGEAEAEGAQMRVPVIANPKQNPSKQEQRGQNGEGAGFLHGRIEGHHGYRGEIGRKLLEGVQDKLRVDFECRARFGRSAYPHLGIEALSRNDANPNYARQ